MQPAGINFQIKSDVVTQKGQMLSRFRIGGLTMKFLDMEWYWWLIILAGAAVIIPVKVKFMKWWSRKQKEEKDSRNRWGDEE